MPVVFKRSQTLTRGGLDVYLRDEDDRPVDAATITYAIYDYTTGTEILIGDPARVPVNPDIGEYYAAFVVPTNANIGPYRIRWNFRAGLSDPLVEVVQEWGVVESDVVIAASVYSANQTQLMRRIRILLRDQCLGGEETVELDVAGERMVVSLEEFWEAING